MEKEIIVQTAQLISKELYIEEELIGLPDQMDLLRERVAAVVKDLLDFDFGQLLNLLYLMDVDEEKLKEMLHETGETDPHYMIADMIIEREMQKVLSRQKYKQKKLEDDEEAW